MHQATLESQIEKLEAISLAFMRFIQSRGMCHKLNLTFPQCALLQIVHRAPQSKMSELAQRLGVSMANLTNMTDRLIKNRLINRLPDSHDRRVVRIELTGKGQRTINAYLDNKRSHMKDILSRFSDRERAIFINLMQKLGNFMQEGVND
jgi:DNA-binding MarR family transcriptional regulator